MTPQRLVRLYPEAWRQRYGDEFAAVLEQQPASVVEVLDIVWGAMDAHLFPQAPEGRFRMFTRIAGLAALTAGIALLVGFIGIFGAGFADLDVNRYTVPVFYLGAIIGLVGIHLRQVVIRPGLAWLGFVAAFIPLGWGIVGIVLSPMVAVPQLMAGELGYLAGAALWIGSVVLGATLLAIRVFPTVVGLLLTVSSPVAMIGLLVGNTPGAGQALQLFAQGGILLFAVAWVGIGLSLLTAQPREGVLGSTA